MASPLRQFVDQLWFADKTRGLVQFKNNYTPLQDRILAQTEQSIDEGRPVRIQILKARQMGCSTITEAIMFATAFLLPGMRGMVVSHEGDSNEHLLAMTQLYWDMFWAKSAYTPKHLATNKLAWVETRSRITVATAKNTRAGRSQTIHFLHGSEVAFWDNPELLMKGLHQVLPRKALTFSYLESTANGVGNWWHQKWKAAQNHDDEYTAMFFGWWEHPDYVGSAIGLTHELTRPLIFGDDEEKILARFLTRKGMDAKEVHNRLLWRRSIIATEANGDVETFHQEYPTTPEEAFVATGRNVFPLRYLRAAYEPMHPDIGMLVRDGNGVKFIHDPHGPLRVYVYPGRDQHYMVAGDPSWAATGDYACAQVLNRRTWEQAAVFRDKIDAATLGQQMVMLGRWYNEAMLCPESVKAGGASIGAIRTLGYDNIFIQRKTTNVRGQLQSDYGWATNQQTKYELVSNMQKALFDGAQPQNMTRGIGIRLHDQQTYDEMKEYVVVGGRGTFGNSDGTEHDDCVMAVCIALTATMLEAGELLGGGLSEPKAAAAGLNVRPEPEPAFADKLAELGVAEGATFVGPGQMMEAGPSSWLDQLEQEAMYEGDYD